MMINCSANPDLVLVKLHSSGSLLLGVSAFETVIVNLEQSAHLTLCKMDQL